MLRVTQLSGFGGRGTAAAANNALTAGAGSYSLTGTAATLTKSAASPASAFLARTTGLDGTHVTAYTNLINGLVTDGVWAKLDVLHVYATQDATTALLNLVSTSFTGTANGSPSFTADRGYTGVDNSNTVYIDTQFNPTTASSPKFTTNSAHLSAWSNTATRGATGGMIIGSRNASFQTDIIPEGTDGKTNFYCNSNGAPTGITSASAAGHYITNREVSTDYQGYKNGAQIFTRTTGSVAPASGTFHVLKTNNISGSDFGVPLQTCAASVGGGLTGTEAGNFYTRLRTYMTAVGVP
jgi:hypothetical protein